MSKDVALVKKRRYRLPLLPVDEMSSPPTKTSRARKYAATALRLIGFAVLLLLAARFLDMGPVLGHVRSMSLVALSIMTALHVLIILLTSWRFAAIAQSFGTIIPLREATRLTFNSTLANMLLPTSLAGDAGRIVLVRRFSMTLRSAVGAGIYDRVIGLASLGVVVLVGSLAAPSIVPTWSLVAISGVVAALVAVIIWRASPSVGTGAVTHKHNRSKDASTFGAAVASSLTAHFISIAIAAVFLTDQGSAFDVAQLFVLFPAVLLAGSVPVSVGGWGTRELAAGAAFATVGLASSTAVAMAFMFGVTQVAAAALGTAGYFVFVQKHIHT
jgi:uncharacterized membrane protein YbhN (UPF0104 family)